VFYLIGLGASAAFWYRLLRDTGQRANPISAVRAYYLGHLGKYLPGKAWALFLRATLIRGPGVSLALAVMTSLYEVLATMAAGVLLAAGFVILWWPAGWRAPNRPTLWGILTSRSEDILVDRQHLLVLAGILIAIVGTPLLPPIFNWLVRRVLTIRLRMSPTTAVSADEARIGPLELISGLCIIGVGWLFLGLSLAAAIQASAPAAARWDWPALGRYTACLGLAYVAGFVIVLVPSGLGIREFLLTMFLLPEVRRALGNSPDAEPIAFLSVIVLRVVWTAAEIVMAVLVYWLPGPALHGEPDLAAQEAEVNP
jgi:hypothetical protein